MKGKWEGNLCTKRPDGTDSTILVAYQDCKLTIVDSEGPEAFKVEFTDEGKGKCRCRSIEEGLKALGIYKWQRNQLFICMSENGKRRPTTFTVDGAHSLLILHRVKPRK